MIYWTLLWLIATQGDDGIETRVYEAQVRFSTPEACYAAQAALDKKLLAEGYENFTTACEERIR